MTYATTRSARFGSNTPSDASFCRWCSRNSPALEYTDPNTGSLIFNLWRGFAVKPIAGTCALLLEHLRHVVCHDNVQLYDYLLNWMARAVQLPGERGHVALVFKGKQGSGKSTVVDYLENCTARTTSRCRKAPR